MTAVNLGPKVLSRARAMMKTVDEANSDKTKVQEEFIFRSVLLDCFTAKLDEQTDSQSM